MRRRTLLAAPAAALLLGGAGQVAERIPGRGPVAATPISRLDTPWWKARFLAKQRELTRGPVDLLWLGDSITQDWELDGPEEWRDFAPSWQHFYGDRHAVNLGFKGDNTSHLLWRMQNGELDGIQPKAAVVLIGANNMGRVHWNAEQTVAGIEAVVAELRRRLPATKVLLLAVLPSIRSKYVTRTTAEVNRTLAGRFSSSDPLTYMDVGSLFMRSGEVDRAQFLDDHLTPPDPPLHPTAQAQRQIAEAIEPTLAAMMGDRRH